MAQAPTGIGKTVDTLFPLLKAWPKQQLDKIYFLTAKSAGRQLALDALTTLDATPLRVVKLVAQGLRVSGSRVMASRVCLRVASTTGFRPCAPLRSNARNWIAPRWQAWHASTTFALII